MLRSALRVCSRPTFASTVLPQFPQSIVQIASIVSLRRNMSTEVVIPAKGKHTATVIFLHGLGDTGHGWSPVFESQLRKSHVKYICPHAETRPVTINMGMQMPAWFDIYGLAIGAKEDEEGIKKSTKRVHEMIDAEIASGIDSKKIVVGGFSMGGAVALYAAFTYPKPLAGCIALSSFLVLRNEIPGNHTANKALKVFQAHGEDDPMVQMVFAQATAAAIQAFNKDNHTFKTYPGMGHSACDQELKDVAQFLKKIID